LGHLSKESIQGRGSVWFFVTNLSFMVKGYPHTQPSSWRTTPCRLSAVAYSIYSQLPSIAGGHPSIRNLRMHHAVVIGTHLTMSPSPLEIERCKPYPKWQFFVKFLTFTSIPLTFSIAMQANCSTMFTLFVSSVRKLTI
jgi:hypothetical protein